MMFARITKYLAIGILIVGTLGAFITVDESSLTATVTFISSLVSFVIIYGIGEIVEVLHKINDKQNQRQ